MFYLLLALVSLLGVAFRFLWQEFLGPDSLTPSLFVNLLGSFSIGLVYGLQSLFSSQLFLWLAVGFLGSLTTLSGLSLEIFKMLEKGNYLWAFNYGVLTLFLSVGLCILGFYISKIIL